MYSLFSRPQPIHGPEIVPANWDYLKRSYDAEVRKIVAYFSNRPFFVKSNHLLCRIINTALAPIHYDLLHFYTVTDARAEYVARHFKLTSSGGPGQFFQGDFYGEGMEEIILYDDELFSLSDVVNNWKNVQAVKVIDHPISTLNLMVPNGIKHSTEEGRAVISINIAKLMIQYRCFVLEQKRRLDAGGTSLLGVTHFVAMYVLPNMLYSHTDKVILNRLMNLALGAPMGAATMTYVFPVKRLDNALDKSLLTIVKYLENRSMDYSTYLRNCPAIFAEDQLDALKMPDIGPTRQVWWALQLSRLSVIEFLITHGGQKGINANRSLIGKMKIDISRLMNEHVFTLVLPKYEAQQIESEFGQLLKT